MQADGAADAAPLIVTSRSFTDLARLVQLDNGHQLLAARGDQREDRDRGRKV
jgi:hypothetical protein